jgi:RNA polymerase sigma-70 factor (ECF subfamily)
VIPLVAQRADGRRASSSPEVARESALCEIIRGMRGVSRSTVTLPGRDPEFVLEHSGFVRNLAQRLVFDADLARDVEQQTWLAALENCPPKGAAPRAWLATLVRNFAFKAWRGAHRREQREQAFAESTREVPTPAEILERESMRREIVEAVLALDEPWRAALILRFFEELPTQEVARILAVPHATARTRIKRGLELLRARLEQRRGASGSAWALAIVRSWRLEPLSYRAVAVAAAKSVIQGVLIVTAAQKIVIGAAAIALIAASLFVWDRGRGAEPQVAAAPQAKSTDVEISNVADVATQESARHEPAAQVVTPESQPLTPSDACNVFGRAIDEHDQPLAGVAVRLSAYKEWASGVDVPRVPAAYDARGWDTTTDAEGAFHFTTPVPTAQVVALSLTPDVFRDLATDRFGTSSSDVKPPLHAGDNDLGVYRLVATGAIRGRVVDEAGAPIVGAKLRIGPDRTSTLGRDAVSDAKGEYVIGHVKAGSYGVNCEHIGHLSRFDKPFVVEIDRFADGVDFRLAVAPSLRGVVVAEDGRGIEGAKLWGWPQSSGSGAAATSTADGSFTVFLPQDEPYTLECQRDGFEPYHVGDRSTHYPPGSVDLRIVMTRDVMTRFVVVDETTNRRVERFGISILRDAHRAVGDTEWLSISHVSSPRVADHPGGELEVGARPGLDEFTLTAPGYPSTGGVVEHDSPDSNIQTVRLAAGLSMTGRVVFNNAPVVGAIVRLERGGMGGPSLAAQSFHVDRDGGMSTTNSGADGRFKFTGLEGGMYRLVASASGGESVELEPFTLGWTENKDLGDVVLFASGSIVGRVLVPPGRALAGLSIHLDSWQSSIQETTDAQGAFRFASITPGKHSLLVGDVPGALAGGDPFAVLVEAGTAREIELDLRDRGTCEVRLMLICGAGSSEGVQVTLRPTTKRDVQIQLGSTDGQGRVVGSAPALGDARVEVYTTGGVHIVHPTALVHLRLDEPVDQTIDFHITKLVVELPPSATLPPVASASLSLHVKDANSNDDCRISVPLRDGAAERDTVPFDPATRRFTFNCVPAGEFELTFELLEPRVETTASQTWHGYRAFFTRTLSTSLRVDIANEIVLR